MNDHYQLKTPHKLLTTPTHCFGGNADPFVSVNDLQEWSRWVKDEVKVYVFDGGHMYITSPYQRNSEVHNNVAQVRKFDLQMRNERNFKFIFRLFNK
jgi:surfactin synthase thioesterase subunit